MKNYDNMSDFEINKAVAYATGWDTNYWHSLPDYCNSWADAGSIIQDNKINLAWDDIRQTWVAYSVGARHNATSANPLRAAMEVFLSMEEARRGV